MEQKNSKKKSVLKNALLFAGGAAVGILVYNNRAKIGGAMKSAYSSIKTRVGNHKKCDTVGATEQPQVTVEVKAPVTEVHEVPVNNYTGNVNNNGERYYKPRYENNNNKFNNN